MDELFEALTLAQTKKIQSFPIILYGSEYWKGLIDWMKQTLVPNGTIGREDFALFSVVDTPEEICFLINEHYRVFGGVRPESRARKQVKTTGRNKVPSVKTTKKP
jgi:predicted Rossmann-fold nucleotide-binding protein